MKTKLFVKKQPSAASFFYAFTGGGKNEGPSLEQDLEETLSQADINAICAALDEANEAAETVIASMDRLHLTMQDCHRELRLARQIVQQSNERARAARQASQRF